MKGQQGFTYAEMEDILAQVFNAGPQDALPKLRARYKKLQQIGVPSGDKPLRGQKGRYSVEQLCEVALCIELAEFGLPLQTISSVINYEGRKVPFQRLAELVGNESNLDPELGQLIFAFETAEVSSKWLESERTFLFLGTSGGLSEFMKSGLRRAAVTDLSGLAKRLADAILSCRSKEH